MVTRLTLISIAIPDWNLAKIFAYKLYIFEGVGGGGFCTIVPISND